jgi:hypothetical protein
MSNPKTQSNANSPELAALLNKQSALAALEKKLSSIDRAISEQHEKREQARAAAPPVREIEAQIEQLLASEATGSITDQERAKRESELQQQLAKTRAAAAGASEKAYRVQATVTGLEAQRRDMEKAVMQACRECHRALDIFLMSEAERVGREYLAAAKIVRDRHLQLVALGQVHMHALRKTVNSITQIYADELLLPAFKVGGHDEYAEGRAKSLLFFEGSFALNAMCHEAISPERQRIEDMGAALEWLGARFYRLAKGGEVIEEEMERSSDA